VGLDLFVVEFKFLAFQDVTIAATRLAGARSNNGVEATSGELIINKRINLGQVLASSNLFQQATRLLDGFGIFRSLTLLAQNFTVVRFVPLTEGGSIDLDDGALDEGLGTDKFVVGSVVDDINDTGLARDGFTGPGERTRVQTESAVLNITSTDTDGVDALLTELGVGRLTTEFELSLLAIVSTLGTSVRTLMTAITANT
jgi:hypothetical protein